MCVLYWAIFEDIRGYTVLLRCILLFIILFDQSPFFMNFNHEPYGYISLYRLPEHSCYSLLKREEKKNHDKRRKWLVCMSRPYRPENGANGRYTVNSAWVSVSGYMKAAVYPTHARAQVNMVSALGRYRIKVAGNIACRMGSTLSGICTGIKKIYTFTGIQAVVGLW